VNASNPGMLAAIPGREINYVPLHLMGGLMKRFVLACGFLFFAAVLAAPLGAGDKKKDAGGPPKVVLGPEHKVLESLTGAFQADVKFFFPDPTKPTLTKGTLSRKMILGGNYLQETFTGEFFGSKFNGIGIIGFDQVKKKYTTAWVDSMSTSMMLLEGTYDAEKKTLTSTGDDFDPMTKKKMQARDVLKIVSADTQTFEMFRHPEGEKEAFKVMEITYTRAEKKTK
jgi:hypothetical protein